MCEKTVNETRCDCTPSVISFVQSVQKISVIDSRMMISWRGIHEPDGVPYYLVDQIDKEGCQCVKVDESHTHRLYCPDLKYCELMIHDFLTDPCINSHDRFVVATVMGAPVLLLEVI